MNEYHTESDRPRHVYARLRVEGEITISYDRVDIIHTLRRLAKKDGLVIVQNKARYDRKRESADQHRTSPTRVALVHPDDPHTIYRPDSPHMSNKVTTTELVRELNFLTTTTVTAGIIYDIAQDLGLGCYRIRDQHDGTVRGDLECWDDTQQRMIMATLGISTLRDI